MAEEIVFKPEGAVHENVRKAYNRGQETMPWEDVETIVNASVFISGDKPGTGALISHKGVLYLLTANSVLTASEDSLKNVVLHFGYVNQKRPGIAISATDLLDTTSCFSHDENYLNYTMVAIHEDVLREKLQKEVPKPVYWDDSGTAQDLKRGDHLYIVQYPKLGDTGEHRRCFGGDIIQGTYGSHIFCAMSAWTGSEGAPLFKTREKSGEPILVGIFSFSQSRPREKDEHESLSNVGSNIHYIKKHVTDKQWSSKDTPERLKVHRLKFN